MIQHHGEEHDLGKVDLVASSESTVKALANVFDNLPEQYRGTFWTVGVPGGQQVRTASAMRKISRGPRRFTIVDHSKSFRFIGERTGWAMDGNGN